MHPAQLFIWESRVFYLAQGVIAEGHAHYNASLIVSGDHPFEIRTPEGSRKTLAALVSPNVYHELRAESSRMVILQIDPMSAEYAAVAERFGKAGICDVERPPEIPAAIDAISPDCPSALAFVRMLLEKTAGYVERPHRKDERVERLVRLLKDHITDDMPENVSVDEAARHVGLSADRLMHLFKEEMGLPIRRYVLWLKLRRAVMVMRTEKIRMTEAAHAAGFSDSAHMSRTFKEMFGIPPSFFFANERFVQVHVCEVW